LGNGPGQLHTPTGVAVSESGLIYVADANNGRVDVFNSSDTFESSISTAGGHSLSVPYGIAVSPTGMVYVAEQVGNLADRYFDPGSWVSGTNYFTDSTVGPTSVNVGAGEIMGTSLTLTSAKGLVVGDTVAVDASGSLTLAGGTLSASTLQVGGNFIYQSGSLTVSTLNILPGGFFQDDQVPSLSFSNVVFDGGEMVLDDNVTLTTPSLIIQPGGVLAAGVATISPSFMSVENGGELQLTNPISSRVETPIVYNDGLVDGSGRIAASLTNYSDGQLSAATAQTLVISGAGNTNAGTISLAGGTIHFTQDLSNQPGGVIAGFGTLRVDGGLTNDGTISPAGSAAFFGPLTNQSDGTIHLSGTGPNTFYGAADNEGSLAVDPGASGTFYASFSGAGPILDNGYLDFTSDSSTGPISGSGIITVGSSSGPAALTILPAGTINHQSAIALTAGSKLDLTSNTLVLNTNTPGHDAASILAALAVGYDQGTWAGNGITSSLAASNVGTALGYSIDGNIFTIKYTWLGDANLDGVVNTADLSAISSAGTTWQTGDFNYDGKVNADDYALFALGDAESAGANISTKLPEPSLFLSVTCLVPLICRRCRQG
jgi:hypothetical protein